MRVSPVMSGADHPCRKPPRRIATLPARQARHAIYLDRTSAMAHFTLGSILLRLGDGPGAWRSYRNARDLSEAQPPDEPVPAESIAAVEELLRRVGTDAGLLGVDEVEDEEELTVQERL